MSTIGGDASEVFKMQAERPMPVNSEWFVEAGKLNTELSQLVEQRGDPYLKILGTIKEL